MIDFVGYLMPQSYGTADIEIASNDGSNIALVTALNIINSISMSESVRIKQYGTMRAVGMDKHQITK